MCKYVKIRFFSFRYVMKLMVVAQFLQEASLNLSTAH